MASAASSSSFPSFSSIPSLLLLIGSSLLILLLIQSSISPEGDGGGVMGAVFNRYHPIEFERPQKVTVQHPVTLEMELLAYFRANEQMKRVARKALHDFFTGQWAAAGDEAMWVGAAMDYVFGGFWDVYVFDADFDAAYTTIRRSPHYMLWRVNNRAVLIAQQGQRGDNTRSRWGAGGKGNDTDVHSILLRRRR